MKPVISSLLAAALLSFVPSAVGQPQPNPRAKDAEPLPEYPKADPKNTVTPLNPDKTLFAEITPEPNKKVIRIGLVTEVCLREGPLEVFLCKRGTKEHESITRADLDGKFIHAALEAAGARPGKPTRFVDPRTNEQDYKPATGTKIKVAVHYKKDGKLHTHPAQEWIWNNKTKKPIEADWVFAGSMLIKDPDRPNDPPFYGANSGEFISVSNFPYSMLELPVEITKDDANLFYEAKTERIPPLFSKVWVILAPVIEKK
jgi:hypothetical protein